MRHRRVIECNNTHDEERFVWSSYERSEIEHSLISGNEAEYLGIETSAAKVGNNHPTQPITFSLLQGPGAILSGSSSSK
jgi:hypothetical protein